MLDRKIAALLAATLLLSGTASADAVVTLCSADNEPVAGMDFRRAMAAGGHITFSCPAGTTIPITMTYAVSVNTQIDGGGTITLDARGTMSMFMMSNADTVLTINGLTLRRGIPLPAAIGGVIRPAGIVSGSGAVAINNSTVADSNSAINLTAGQITATNTDFSNGQGIAIHAPNISLTGCKIHGPSVNPMSSPGGIVTINSSQITASGWSTFDSCRLNIISSQFSSSTSTAVVSSCDTVISSSQFTGNHGSNGGALFLSKTAPGLQISGSVFSGNTADLQGGAIAFEPSTTAGRVLQFADVQFIGNHAQDGGAIHLGAFLENSNALQGRALIFANNVASNTGGAIAGTNSQVTLSRALFTANVAAKSGGAIEVSSFAPRNNVIANTVFTGNTSVGGSVMHGSAVLFTNVTIAGNQGGPAISPFWPTADLNNPEPWRLVNFHNTAFANNAAGGCDNNVWKSILHDSGQNLQFPAAGCPATIPVADPGFDSLFTPLWGGPAVGSGDLTACLASPVNGVDLYGRHRPQGSSCSIGAVEGDLQDPVLQLNPKYGNIPKSAPSTCQCTSPSPLPPNPAQTPSVTPIDPTYPPGSTTTSPTNSSPPSPQPTTVPSPPWTP